MKRDNKVYIQDIFEAIEKIEKYIYGIKEADFFDNGMLQDAVIRNLEIIGESANRLTEDFEDAHPNFPILQAVSMRNVLIHEYNEVDLRGVWDTIKKDLPSLMKQVKQILE